MITKKDILSKIDFCDSVIEEYQKDGILNPFELLTDSADRKTKLYCTCVEYVYELEKLTDELNAKLKKCL